MQYREGTVSVENGSTTVTGDTQFFTEEVEAGDLFHVVGTNVTYEIASVTDDTHLELAASYAGETGEGFTYVITRDFTPILKLPVLATGDIETIETLKKQAEMLDGMVLPTDALDAEEGDLLSFDGDVWVNTSLEGTDDQVIVTPSTGTITLSLPQDIATDSTPTFGQVTLSNAPSNATDATTKSYVDSVAAGLKVKEGVRVRTDVNQNVSSMGGSSFDAVSLSNGDRMLLVGQTTTSQNGIWIFNGTGNALTRPADFNSSSPTSLGGTTVFVNTGSTYGNTYWVLTTDNPIIVDTTGQVWAQFGGPGTYSAGTGLTLTGGAFSINAGYVGQASITTLGTIATGVWNGTTVATGYGGTGVTGTPTNGQLLIGNGSGYTLATITAGTGVSVTNGAGTITLANTGVTSITGTTDQVVASASTGAITLSLPQSINTSSAPRFTSVILRSNTAQVTLQNAAQTQQWQFPGYNDGTGVVGAYNSTLGAWALQLVNSTAQMLLPRNITSTSASTGALVVTGGVGINENLNVSGTTKLVDAQLSGKLGRSLAATVSAAGSNQAGATALTKDVNVVSSATGGSAEGVRLPAGDTTCSFELFVLNTTAVTVKVYPTSGGSIDALSTNAAFDLPAGAKLQFISTSATRWHTLNATYV